jgi:hypothetical protein
MADPYGLELSGLTPELSAEAAALARRQKVAEAMGMQAQQGLPVNRMAGNMAVSISPFEGAAQLMRAYSSRKALDDVDARRQDIARRGREAVANEVARIQGIGADKPGQVFQPATPNDDEGNAIPSAQGPAIPGDKNRMVTEAMMSSLPQVQKYGQVLSGQVQADKTLAATQAQADKVLAAQQEFNRQENISNRQARLDGIMMQLTSREMEGEQNRALRERLQTQADQMRRDIAQLSADARRDVATVANSLKAPTLTTIAEPGNPANTIVVDARVYKGGGVGSLGVLGSGPKMTEAGKLDAKAAVQMKGVGADLQRAEDILSGVTRNSNGEVVPADAKPTGSGIGALYDKAAGLVGMAPSGANEAAALRTVGAKLTAGMPRFEGPQSNQDVNFYKEMVGKVGDETLPRETRLQALQEAKRIYGEYESGKRGRILGGGAPAAPGNAAPIRISDDAGYNALPKGARYVGPDGVERQK